MPRFAIEDLENIYRLPRIDLETLYRAYNGLVSIAMLYQYMHDPHAQANEYLPDAVLHALEALGPNRWRLFAIGANGMRAMQAGWAVLRGLPAVPQFANVADVGNHFLILHHRRQQAVEVPPVADAQDHPVAKAKPE